MDNEKINTFILTNKAYSVLTDVLYVWVEFCKVDIIYVPAVNTAVGTIFLSTCRRSACLAM